MSDVERQALLRAFKRGLEPTSADQDRNASALAAKVAAATGAAGAGTAASTKGAASSALKLALSSKIKLALIVVATGGAATGVYELRSTPSTTSAVTPAPNAATPTTSPIASASSSTVLALPSPPTVTIPVSATATPVSAPVADAVPSTRPSRINAAAPSSPQSTGGSVGTMKAPDHAGPSHVTSPASTAAAPEPSAKLQMNEEIALVRAMHDALAKRTPERAIAIADEHARRFPDGLLGLEVEGLRIVAECQRSGHTPETTRSAASFTARHPRAPIVDRVRAACGVE